MKKKKPPPQSWGRGLLAALDVGTTKVSCFIAQVTGDEARIVGIGHQASRGLRAGTFIDLDAAEVTIRSTVEAAERMVGDNIRSVSVNVSAGNPTSRLIAYEIAVAGHEIGETDVRRILDPREFASEIPPDHEVLHAVPVGYSIDGCRGVRDPRGMFGQRLGVNLHLITAASASLRNLSTCVSRCHLDVGSEVVSAYAAALGCLVDDETALGVTVVDMGGGTTSIAVFFDGELVFTDSIPIGGMHVTSDIAHGLSTPLTQAERLKTLFGSCMPSPSDDRQLIDVPPLTNDASSEYGRVPRSMLVNIIRPRIEETFEMIRARLEDAGFQKVAGRRLVLTGGASQLAGTPELAGMILDKQVRLARPRPTEGLPEAVSGPAFSVCAGLLHYDLRHPPETQLRLDRDAAETSGRFGRIGQWLRENF